jgi:triosephosphate isomerase
MSRKPLISGNWKMNHNHFEAIQTVQKLGYLLASDDYEAVDVTVHPPFTDIRSVQTTIETEKKIFVLLGAQNCYFEDSGAFTGEVAPGMLAKLNVAYVIVGHSERREVFGETDEWVQRKVAAVLKYGMTPILCVGETLDEREQGVTMVKVRHQVAKGLEGVGAEQVAGLAIAYEPIWAIGTGKTATAEDAQSVCELIRSTVCDLYDDDTAASVRIQYGGSVKANNAAELMNQADVDGLLVGGASLDPEEFARIVKYRMSGLNAVINAAETGEVPDAVKVVPDMEVPEPSAADKAAEWIVMQLALHSATVGEPLSDVDLVLLRTPAIDVAEHPEHRTKMTELNNRVVPLTRGAIEAAKQSGGVVQVEVRKGLKIPQDWAYHCKAVKDANQGWMVTTFVHSALGRNVLAGERRDWKSK